MRRLTNGTTVCQMCWTLAIEKEGQIKSMNDAEQQVQTGPERPELLESLAIATKELTALEKEKKEDASRLGEDLKSVELELGDVLKIVLDPAVQGQRRSELLEKLAVLTNDRAAAVDLKKATSERHCEDIKAKKAEIADIVKLLEERKA